MSFVEQVEGFSGPELRHILTITPHRSRLIFNSQTYGKTIDLSLFMESWCLINVPAFIAKPCLPVREMLLFRIISNIKRVAVSPPQALLPNSVLTRLP